MSSNQTTTTATGYTITRVLDAPVDKVWHVWTDPEHYTHWFNARPGTVHLDVRTGGSWRAVMIGPDGSENPLSGGYGEVEPHKRIVTTMDVPGGPPAEMDFQFRDLGDRTEVFVAQECSSPEERDMAKDGSEYLMDAFSTYLATV